MAIRIHSIVKNTEKERKGEIAEQIALVSKFLQTHGRKLGDPNSRDPKRRKESGKEEYKYTEDCSVLKDKYVFPVEKSITSELSKISNFDFSNYGVIMNFGFFDGEKKQKVFSNGDKTDISLKEMLASSNALSYGSGIKNISVELQGTNSANRDFSVVTISMKFSSFDEIFRTKALQLLEKQKDAYLEIGHKFFNNESKNNRRKEFEDCSKLFLKLKYVIHSLSYEPSGEVSIEAKYATYVDFYNDSSEAMVYRPEGKDSDRLPELQRELVKLNESDSSSKEEQIRELKSKISSVYTSSYQELTRKIDLRQEYYETDTCFIPEPEDVKAGTVNQNPDEGNLTIYKYSPTKTENNTQLEYYLFGDLVKAFNNFFEKFYNKSSDSKVSEYHDGKIYLGKIYLNSSRFLPSSESPADTSYQKITDFLEVDRKSISAYSVVNEATEIFLENLPITKKFLESFLAELDFSEVSSSDGISARKYIDKVVYGLVGKIMSLYNDSVRSLVPYTSPNISGTQRAYNQYESMIYKKLNIVPFFLAKNGVGFKRKRKNYLWRDKSKNIQAMQCYYIHQVDDQTPPIEIKFGNGLSSVKSIQFDPLDTKLFDVALVNAFQGRGLNDYGITDVVRTIYKVDLKMLGVSFITPGTIIKLSRNSFPTLSSNNSRKHLKEFTNMLTQEYLVTKVTHTLNSKNNYETQITAHPYKMIR